VFDIGLQELIVIFIVALLVLGPKKLPEVSRVIGRGLAELKSTLEGVKEQVETEIKETTETIETHDIQETKGKEEKTEEKEHEAEGLDGRR
jgi:sec-independent protein translocase protein TatB